MTITVYSLENCRNCVTTKNFMNKRSVPYTEGYLSRDVADKFSYYSAPLVTETNEEGQETVLWAGGVNIDGILGLARRDKVAA